MDLELKGKVAVVTGASVGIGRVIATTLAAEGMCLALVARRGELLNTLQQELNQSGAATSLVIARDLTEPNAGADIRDQVLAAFGGIDVLVNNAGGSRPLPIDAPEEAWTEAIELNFTAVRRLTPVEYERLQGFPDRYTDIPWRGKNWTPDGPRYKALGNSMAVPGMAWIGRRLKMHLEGLL